MQVQILEEAAARDRLSPVQFGGENASVSLVSYHFRALLKAGLLERAGTAPRRGATEHFYRLSRRARD
jgi:DNA-binding transcriptional ArsR family regulator